MSNHAHRRPRRLTPAQSAVAQLLGPLDGARTPGGCDQCRDPYQTVEPLRAGMWQITVHHDDDCPVLRQYQERSA